MTALPLTKPDVAPDYIRVGVGTFLVNSKGEFLIGLRKSKHGYGTWGLVGGHVEPGETHEDTAIRETIEEIGVTLKRPQLFDVTSDIFPESGLQYLTIFMIERVPDDLDVRNLEPHKLEEWKWVAPESVPINLLLPLANLWHNIGGADGFRKRLKKIS